LDSNLLLFTFGPCKKKKMKKENGNMDKTSTFHQDNFYPQFPDPQHFYLLN